MFTASKNRDSAWGIWRISWWVISSLMPSIFRICVSKAWESKMWSRLCYTYIYVDATPSITEASLSLYAAVKNQSSTQTWGIQHAMRSLTLTICCFIPWDSLLQCTAQVRHGCLERLKSTQLKSPHSWPLQVKSTSTQNILSFQRTWKRHGRRLNFVIFLTTCILPCETVHDIFTTPYNRQGEVLLADSFISHCHIHLRAVRWGWSWPATFLILFESLHYDVPNITFGTFCHFDGLFDS